MGNKVPQEETVKERAREWQRQIKSEQRRLDRDINRIRQEEVKLKKEITAMANKGQVQSVRTLAKQVVRSRTSVVRLERTKCSMQAVSLHLTTSIASMSTASALKMSGAVMKEMNRLMNIPELQNTMEEMRREMARAEITDEMMEEGFEASDDETQIDTEVQKVFDELALDKSAYMDAHGAASVPTPAAAAPAAAAPAPLPADDPLMQRLQALQK
mmetsp:Transcript_32459/g.82700  ORF Transcript_32459/g.82700 Transcript_32459/m.82700 type:complete len:215 (-) Transcript_32459:95-739(-)